MHRKHVCPEVLSFFDFQRKFHFLKKIGKVAKEKSLGETISKTVKLVNEIEEV